jgi:IS5 family transposase
MSIFDFGMPLGVALNPENRWVKKANQIPWDEIEARYASLFKSYKGNVAKHLRLALGALIIQAEYQYSDVEVPLQIQETPCLQYFCGLPEYKDKMPFDSSLMVHFRKRLTPEILGEINEMIIKKAEQETKKNQKDDSDQSNSGTLIVDSTCAPQNIRFPQDTSLLNEAREDLESMIDEMHCPSDGVKPRTYRRKARRDYLQIAKKKKKSAKMIRKAVGKQLRYIRRDLAIVESLLQEGKKLSEWKKERLSIIKGLNEQQKHMYENRTQQVDNRIVSLSQPWVRPIVRGKAKEKCEFGAKLDISVSDGFARLEHTSFDAYNESVNLAGIIERYKDRTGHYPERVLADQIYRSRENIKYCKERGIRISGKPLGRPKREADIDKRQEWRDQVDRIEVERKFSHVKGSFGLGLIRTKLKETSYTAISLSILVLNLARIVRDFLCSFLRYIFIGKKNLTLYKLTFIQ